jgi:hypothetical protein
MPFDPSTALPVSDNSSIQTSGGGFDPSTATPIDHPANDMPETDFGDFAYSMGKKIGGMAKGTFDYLTQTVPELMNPKNMVGLFTHPVESTKGELKGVAKGILNLIDMATAGIGLDDPKAYKDLMKGDVPTKHPVEGLESVIQPSNEAQANAARYGEGAVLAATGGIPGAGLGESAVAKAGELVGDVGKASLKSGLKIPKTIAKQASKNVAKGEENITNTLIDNDAIGSFDKIPEKAQAKIDAEKARVDQIISDIIQVNPGLKVNIQNIADGLKSDIGSGNQELIDLGNEDAATAHIDNIMNSPRIAKYLSDGPEVSLDVANQIKKEFGKGKFKKGAPGIADDPTRSQVQELLDLKLRDEIQKSVPKIEGAKIEGANRRIHDLVIAKKAAEDAAYRVQKKNFIGLGDYAMGGGLGILLEHLLHSPTEAGIGALTLYAARKAAQNGRGSSALIRAGRAIENSSETVGAVAGTPAGASLLKGLTTDDNEAETER